MAEVDEDEQDITQLLQVEQTTELSPENEASTLTTVHLSNLYLSHALSTWNARTYEFAVVASLHSSYMFWPAHVQHADPIHSVRIPRYIVCIICAVS